MKALVTGADGFVGRHLLEHLRAKGDDVVGVDRECDVTDVASVRAILASTAPDAVYHLAAMTAVGGIVVASGRVHPSQRTGHEEGPRRRERDSAGRDGVARQFVRRLRRCAA